MEEQASSFQFDWQNIVRVYQRRKKLFLIVAIPVYLSAVAASFIAPRVYQAEAKILVDQANVVNPLLRNLAVTTSVQSRINGLREEILAWPRLLELVERLGLIKKDTPPGVLEGLIRTIRRNISLQMRSSDLVVIAYQHTDPRQTQVLVNTLCDILIQQNVSRQAAETGSAIDFITDQLEIYKKKLESSDAALREFKEVYGLGAGPGVEEVSPAGVTLRNINKELAALEAELVFAGIDNTDLHPRVQSLRERIAALKDTRNEYIRKAADKAGVDHDLYVRIADSFPRQQEELTRLTRDKSINSEMYSQLLQKLESAQLTDRLDHSDNRTKFRIIEPGRLPIKPIKPSKIKYNLIGLFLGCACGLGLIYLLETMNASFKNEDQLAQAFNEPVLGSISLFAPMRQPGRLEKLFLFLRKKIQG